MREITVKLYRFDELPTEKAKEKARDWWRESAFDSDWWDGVQMDAENVGLKIKAFDIDRGSYCEVEFITSAPEVIESILKEHGPTCETHKTAKEYQSRFEKFRDRTTDELTREEESERDELEDEFQKAIGEDYLQMLRAEYEYQNSAEYIDETLVINGYEFTEEGKLS